MMSTIERDIRLLKKNLSFIARGGTPWLLKRWLNIVIASILPQFITASPVRGADTAASLRPSVQAVRINEELQLSGKLDDPHWNLAQPTDIAYEIQTGDNAPAPQKTAVRVLYNSEFIYFGFDCEDTSPSEIRTHITDRDRLYSDDFIIVMLDTYGDNQRTYEFFVNPYGIQGDALRSGNNEDDSFDAVWFAKAAVNNHGWTAEMAIPFKSLRFPSKQEQTWIALLGRNYPRQSRMIFSWTKIDKNNPCLPCQGGALTGIRDLQTTTLFEVLPFATASSSGSLKDTDDPSSTFENGAMRGRIGGGVKYSPDPGLVVEGVVNPDFSQVESDAGQISVNTTFALFYSEKRPFFLEGADLFRNWTNTFYSRTINNPLAAVKLTRKTGALSLSYLSAFDRNTPYIVPGEEGSSYVSSPLESFSNIARARYDLGQESFIGGMVTARSGAGAHNYVGGIDWNYFFGGNYYFRGEAFLSDTREVNDLDLLSDDRRLGSTGHDAAFNGETYTGSALRVELLRNARDYSFGIGIDQLAPTFQAQNGFVAKNNLRRLRLSQDYTFYWTDSFLDRASVFTEMGVQVNYDGLRKERWIVLGGNVLLKSQTNVNVVVLAVNQENFKQRFFPDIPRVFFNIYSNASSMLSGGLYAQLGRFIYRSDVPEMGRGHNAGADVTVRATSKLRIDLSYSRAQLTSLATGELFYDGYILRSVAAYQFTAEFFLRAIGQYNSFDRSVELYPLISYKLNPFTIFYAGSTHSLSNFDEPYGFTQTTRQFFVKLQYLWRN